MSIANLRLSQAERTKVLYDNGFVDIVLPDGSVLSLKVDESKPELWRYESVEQHCEEMGDPSFIDTYFDKEELEC